MTITVSIVEDRRDHREKFVELINRRRGFRCLRAYPTAEAALQQIPLEQPEVVLMDLGLPKLSGIECVELLKASISSAKILMLTVHGDARNIVRALRAGADGYVHKDAPTNDLFDAITSVSNGVESLSADVAAEVVKYFNEQGHRATEAERLTPDEMETLDLLAKGLRNKEIADQLGTAEGFIKERLKSIYAKLRVSNRTEAVVRWLKL